MSDLTSRWTELEELRTQLGEDNLDQTLDKLAEHEQYLSDHPDKLAQFGQRLIKDRDYWFPVLGVKQNSFELRQFCRNNIIGTASDVAPWLAYLSLVGLAQYNHNTTEFTFSEILCQ